MGTKPVPAASNRCSKTRAKQPRKCGVTLEMKAKREPSFYKKDPKKELEDHSLATRSDLEMRFGSHNEI